jgi:hypothetical protein
MGVGTHIRTCCMNSPPCPPLWILHELTPLYLYWVKTLIPMPLRWTRPSSPFPFSQGRRGVKSSSNEAPRPWERGWGEGLFWQKESNSSSNVAPRPWERGWDEGLFLQEESKSYSIGTSTLDRACPASAGSWGEGLLKQGTGVRSARNEI